MWRISYIFPNMHFHGRSFSTALFRQTRFTLFCLLEHPLTCVATMAPHLTLVEQSRAVQASAKNETPNAVFDMLQNARRRQGVAMVNITVVRRFLKGTTHKRGKEETRGRKRIYSRRNVLSMNAARRKYIKGTKGTKQATWKLVIRKARGPRADATTAARAFAREGLKPACLLAHIARS